MQIYFNPLEVGYNRLLDIFFASHNPANRSYSRQYMSLVLYHDEEQKDIAQRAIDRLQKKGTPVQTELSPYSRFFLAEGYHQKYYLRRVSALINEVEGRYQDLEELVSSSVASKLNGYVGGYGTLTRLSRDLEQFGLSEKAEKRLIEIVSSR